MVVVVGKGNRMIDVSVVQYFGLTRGMLMWSSVDASPFSESHVG